MSDEGPEGEKNIHELGMVGHQVEKLAEQMIHLSWVPIQVANRKARTYSWVFAPQAYQWPGNVRELEQVIEYALSMVEGNTIKIASFPEEFVNPVADHVAGPESWVNAPFSKAKEEFEKFYLTQILKESHGNISEASRKAQMFRQDLQQKIRK